MTVPDLDSLDDQSDHHRRDDTVRVPTRKRIGPHIHAEHRGGQSIIREMIRSSLIFELFDQGLLGAWLSG